MGRLARLASTLKQKYREEKAHLKGEGISKARMIKNAKDIPDIADQVKDRTGPARPIDGANVRMMDRTPMTFFTDGSLRSSFGAKPDVSGRQRRKLRKRLRVEMKARTPKGTGRKKCHCHVGEANIAYHAVDCPEFNPNGTPKSTR